MIWNAHWDVVRQQKHAILGASKWHWINYTDDKIARMWEAQQAAAMGTRLHEFAAECIRLHQKLPKQKKTLNLYVNDAIGFAMQPEQVLYFSDNCFGTADAIAFRNDFLRIHDLKTGDTAVHVEQLENYAALFCLEYGYLPKEIGMELRIYQHNECGVFVPEKDEISRIMSRIRECDKILQSVQEE